MSMVIHFKNVWLSRPSVGRHMAISYKTPPPEHPSLFTLCPSLFALQHDDHNEGTLLIYANPNIPPSLNPSTDHVL